MKSRFLSRFPLERLEDRCVPASFNYSFSTTPTGTLLTVTQTATYLTTLNVTDGGTTLTLADVGNATSTTIPGLTAGTSVRLDLLSSNPAGTVNLLTLQRSTDFTLNLNNSSAATVAAAGGTVGRNLTITGGSGTNTTTLSGGLAIGNALTLNPASGLATTNINGVTVSGNVQYTSVNGDDDINIGTTAAVTIGGNVNVNTGTGLLDTMDFGLTGTPSSIAGTLYVTGVPTFSLFDSTVGGNATVNTANKNEAFASIQFLDATSFVGGTLSASTGNAAVAASQLIFQGGIGQNLTVSMGNSPGDTVLVDTTASIGGNMSVVGGTLGKTITLSGGSFLGGGLNVTLGSAGTGGNSVVLANASIGKSVYVNLGSTGSNTVSLGATFIGGGLTVYAGIGDDSITDTGGTIIGGNVYVDLGGSGTAANSNSLTLDATSTVGGSSFTYRGGTGSDTVDFRAVSNVSVNIVFSGAPAGTTKLITLGVRPRSAYIDFGFGAGTKTLTLLGTASPVNYSLTVRNA